jgi:O-antigen biosynthesis protein
MSKFSNYISYISRFAKSSRKKEVVNQLLKEIADKGPITGIKSLLHKKSYLYDGDLEMTADIFEALQLDIKRYDANNTTTLPATTQPLVSIIVPMYNQVAYTVNCLCSIAKHCKDIDYEVIVADDVSAEDAKVIKENFPNLIYLRNDTNLGFLRNCNNAAKKARGKYLVLLNNDTQVQPGWLEELLYVFEHFPNTGIAGSKLIYPDGRLQEAGGIIWQDGRAINYGGGDNPLKPEYNYVKEVDYISGASIMIPKILWEEAGGFDELYLPAYCEDSDLCFKVRSLGYKVIYTPFSVVVHFEGVTHGRNLKKGVKQYQVVNQGKLRDKWREELKKKPVYGADVFKQRDRSAGRKHVLVIDHYLPQIEKDAGSRTITNFIDAMLALGYSVHFLGENSNTGKHYEKIFQQKGVEVLYGSQFNFAVQGWRRYLRKYIGMYDAVLLSRSSVCLPIIKFLRANKYHTNIIYYGHDLGYLRLEKEAAITDDAKLRKEAKRIKEAEDTMYSEADNSLVCGYDEIAYLRKYIDKPIHYVPPYFFEVPKQRAGYGERKGIFFIGGFNHPPNGEAVKWFVEEVYGPLHEAGVPFTIAGSKMPEFVLQYRERYPLLDIKADIPVAELEQLYRTVRVAVVPLLSGAGVKGKVIEAFAKGVPVAGTSIAFEGMPKEDAFAYKGRDGAAELREEILRIYNDSVYWTQLSDYSIAYVREHFSKERMESVFKQIIG